MTARETVHTHGCLNCRPDMVPDFTRDDPRYHDGKKCSTDPVFALLDGVPPGYTSGVFEGSEGWVWVSSPDKDIAQIHDCPNCTTRDADGFVVGEIAICAEPRFGLVTVTHPHPGSRMIYGLDGATWHSEGWGA